jgi:cell wall-associated NlpC family hydrolase
VSVPVKAAAATASLTLALMAASATAFADTQFQAEEHARTMAQQAGRALQGLPGPRDLRGLPGLHGLRGLRDPQGLPGPQDPEDLTDLDRPQDLSVLQSPQDPQSPDGWYLPHSPQDPQDPQDQQNQQNQQGPDGWHVPQSLHSRHTSHRPHGRHGRHAPPSPPQRRALRLALVQEKVRHRRAKLIAGWKARASRAVRYAYSQRGRPYVFGGTGRGGFDCSGLVQQSWRHAGVRLARMASTQFHTIRTHISSHRLRPGDLVFFNGLGHVGMYVGHGRFIHSPHTGDHVRVARFDSYYRRAFVGATRPAWHPLPRIPTILYPEVSLDR